MEAERSETAIDLNVVVDLLRDLGLDVDLQGTDTTERRVMRTRAHLTRGASSAPYTLVYGPGARPAAISLFGDGGRTPILLRPHISARTADVLRKAEVQYIDLAGNAWVAFGDVYIDVRGRRAVGGSSAAGGSSTENLFAPRSAQVIFALLTWPALWDGSRREVAQAAGVSLGQAQRTLTAVEEHGYTRSRVDPHRGTLLDLWAAAFPSGLARRIGLAKYRSDAVGLKEPNVEAQIFISGALAVSELLGATDLVVYVPELDLRLPVVNRWRADGRPNVFVREAFWKSPYEEDGPLVGLRDAPWPLVYADLLNTDDPRVRDAATFVRERHADSELG